jgi:hypothetical protein
VVSILFETHLDFAASSPGTKRYTRDQIGDAVLEIGMPKAIEAAGELLASAWAIQADRDDEAPDPGNG